MNPYIIPTTCSVCGEEGMMHACDAGMDWIYGARHRDPAVCAENLRRQRERLNREKKDILVSVLKDITKSIEKHQEDKE